MPGRLIAIAAIWLHTSCAASTLSLGAVTLDVPPGWTHRLEAGGANRATLHAPDGAGVLQILVVEAPEAVPRSTLRLMTNVPEAEALRHGRWGDFAGYHHDYLDDGAWHRTWWLARGATLVLLTYRSPAAAPPQAVRTATAVVRSLTANAP